MQILSGFNDISVAQLLLVAVVALVAAVIGGVSGYGSGALMPLVLVPMLGAAPVVPIIAIAAMFNNFGRVTAFFKYADWPRVWRAGFFALPTCAIGAWGYTFLTGNGAALVIGSMLILSVPLRRLLRHLEVRIGNRGLCAGAVGYGFLVGGTSGSGVIMLSLLMAAGLQGAAVVATDAAVSIIVSTVKISVFALGGVVTAQVLAFALLIGVIAFPGSWLARLFVERMPVHVHTAILDFVVLLGGAMMIASAFR
ncbi:MAG: TSUP family transporter [Pseudolabrys sp.]|jgi:uncharacterized membrane protein YfcA